MGKQEGTMEQTAPWPYDLEQAVDELHLTAGLTGWHIWLKDEDRGQDCRGLTLSIVPSNPDSYHPGQDARTRFIYPVPAAAFNRESWEEWLWARIEETEGHERAEGFCFVDPDGSERRPFKPAHPDGWDPGVVRSVVSDTVVNTPNAGRLVKFPCSMCGHLHHGTMGEHFTIESDRGCVEDKCLCGRIMNAKTERRCIRCGRTAERWWKCCPQHTPELSTDVMCEICVTILHPEFNEVKDE